MAYEHPLYGMDAQTDYLSNYDFNYGTAFANLPAVDIDQIPSVTAAPAATGSALKSDMAKKLAFGAVALFLVYKVL